PRLDVALLTRPSVAPRRNRTAHSAAPGPGARRERMEQPETSGVYRTVRGWSGAVYRCTPCTVASQGVVGQSPSPSLWARGPGSCGVCLGPLPQREVAVN